MQATARVRALEAEVEGLKKAAGGHSKERMLKEKEIKKLQAQKDKKVRLKGTRRGCHNGLAASSA